MLVDLMGCLGFPGEKSVSCQQADVMALLRRSREPAVVEINCGPRCAVEPHTKQIAIIACKAIAAVLVLASHGCISGFWEEKGLWSRTSSKHWEGGACGVCPPSRFGVTGLSGPSAMSTECQGPAGLRNQGPVPPS